MEEFFYEPVSIIRASQEWTLGQIMNIQIQWVCPGLCYSRLSDIGLKSGLFFRDWIIGLKHLVLNGRILRSSEVFPGNGFKVLRMLILRRKLIDTGF